MKKKVGVLTFHGAHNYGSVLQAYALQTIVSDYLEKDCGENNYLYEIINMRIKTQKDLYKAIKKNKSIANVIGNLYNLIHYKDLKKKYNKFEDFINNKLAISKKEYDSIQGVESDISKYDYLISGSDQVWNIGAFDFDWAYYLPFDTASKKISYAASFGSSHKINDEDVKKKVKKYLSDFDYLSVRESLSASAIEDMTNRKPEVLIDPTLMVSREDWEKVTAPKIEELGEYIFFYSLGASSEDIEVLTTISEQLGLPIVISNTGTRNDKSLKAKRVLSAGPEDFLSLIKNAKMVCTTSFHGTVFSLIYNTPFFCMNVENDDRIASLLSMVNLQNRFVNKYNVNEKCKDAYNIEFNKIVEPLKKQQEKSRKYLYSALDIGGDTDDM